MTLRLLTTIRHLVSVNTDMLYATSGLNINTKKAMLYHHSGYLQSVQSVQDKYRTCLLNLKANVDVLRIEYDQLILKAKDNAINILNIAREQGSPLSSPGQVDLLKYHANLFTGPGTVGMAQASISAIPMEQPTLIQPEPALPIEEPVQAVASPPPAEAPPAAPLQRQAPNLVRATFTPVNTPLTNPTVTIPKRNRGGPRDMAGRKRRADAETTDTSGQAAQTDPLPLAASVPSPPPSSHTDQATAEPERETASGASDTAAVANSESPTEILSSDGEAPPKRARNARTIASLFKRPVTMAMGDSLAEDREYWSNQYKKTRELLR